MTRRSLLAAVLLASLLGARGAGAQSAPLDVDITMLIEPVDLQEWQTLFDEVLSGPARPLTLGVTGVTGGDRWVVVNQPAFASHSMVSGGTQTFRVVVTGKVAAPEARRGLSAFEQAVLAMQGGATQNRVTLIYGLTTTSAVLYELHLSRP